jgi:hypothetical protein
MEIGGCLVVLSLAYSLQDERDGNQSGAPVRASESRRRTGKGFWFGWMVLLLRLDFNGRMVERNGGKVEFDGFEH